MRVLFVEDEFGLEIVIAFGWWVSANLCLLFRCLGYDEGFEGFDGGGGYGYRVRYGGVDWFFGEAGIFLV